jgi:hypothetical protein
MQSPDELLEHRWGERFPCQARVRLSTGSGISASGRLRDISASGAFIETAAGLPVDTRVRLVVLGNESAAHVVDLEATVIRVDPDRGVGIEWCTTPARSICAVVGCTVRCGDLDSNRKEMQMNMRQRDHRLEDVEELFAQADEDGDDQISLTEFRGLMLTLDRRMRDGAVTASFLEIDGNHDGRIGLGEFRAWWTRA